MQVERHECHEEVWRTDWEAEPCNKPAKFMVAYLFDSWPVCGIHARRYRNRYGAVLTTLPTGTTGAKE